MSQQQWGPGGGPGEQWPQGQQNHQYQQNQQYQQGQFSQPSPPMPGGPQPPSPRRRYGIWAGVGCALLVIVLAAGAITVGVVHLVRERNQAAAEASSSAAMTTIAGTGYEITIPSTWSEEAISGDESSSGMDAHATGEDRIVEGEFGEEVIAEDITVYRYETSRSYTSECAFQSAFLGFALDDPGEAEELDETQVDGVDAVHYRATGTFAGEDAVAEAWCMEVDGEFLQISATSYGGTELSAETAGVVESFRWT